MSLRDWQLRFWQASEDHRGTPQFPGRVATVVPQAGAEVWGRAYRLAPETEAVLAYLDHREKGGYSRQFREVFTTCGQAIEALCYVGGSDGESFVGPEDEVTTASVIGQAVGPSGKNIDYLRNLHESLSRLGKMEPHVDRLLSLVLQQV